MVIKEFLRGRSDTAPTSTTNIISGPETVSKREPLLFLRTPMASKSSISFGISFNEFSRRSNKTMEELQDLARQSLETGYLISCSGTRPRTGGVLVAFGVNATPRDKAKAYLHAVLLGDLIHQGHAVPDTETGASDKLQELWPLFEKQCESAGWILEKTEIRTQGYELAFCAE
eukprot:CAMPEP_0116850452 /NCGR_PEP_ID=MMETSP0418-20121206/16163_1 /TAXON_ID=1158023 /ORGANISM="Astrosyne radiata, Strain 13vi08-1A" /LENGTH=172 /DNA_ID=CAMNT_0004482341 /DNA_START=127 /DNA_END=645 /DNA_ORIENTATION=+